MSPEKQSALDLAIAVAEKNFGKGTVMRLTENPNIDIENIISTGSIAFDSALGIGGYPRGRIVEIIGNESSGKTSCCLHAIANAQKRGENVLFADMEHCLDLGYAQALGVNLEKLIFAQPNNAEECLQLVDLFVKTGEVGLIVVDSVSALVPKAEVEGEVGDNFVGLQARLMSQALRKLIGPAQKNNTTIIFVNQYRQRIGVMYGDPRIGCVHPKTEVELVLE